MGEVIWIAHTPLIKKQLKQMRLTSKGTDFDDFQRLATGIMILIDDYQLFTGYVQSHSLDLTTEKYSRFPVVQFLGQKPVLCVIQNVG